MSAEPQRNLSPERRPCGPTESSHCFASAEQFHALVRYEQLRAARRDAPLAVVILAPLREEAHRTDLAMLAAILDRRLRPPDAFGPWDHCSLGVVLPDTDEQGAGTLVHDLTESLCGRISLDVRVYTYPFDYPSPDEGVSSTKCFARAGPHGKPVDAAQCARSALETRPLESLLVHPMPIWKRSMDILGAVVGLTLLSPLLAATAVAVKLTSPGPIFFRQLRDGLGGRRFWVLKFRTMYIDAEARKAELMAYNEQDGPAFKLTNDPRITPVGRYLRRTCIDELPQLWHVLKGEMSLVGPRPLDSREAAHCAHWQRQRQSVTPGLTCIWQVYGKTKVSFAEWMRMDLRYIKCRSLWADVKLILATLRAVILHQGSQ